jgi:hypothetical protein
MTFRGARRAAQHLVLAVALVGFTAALLVTIPSLALDENESEREHEIEDLSHVAAGAPVTSVVLMLHAPTRECTHTIGETEVLRTRNVTFRIHRPPPA